MEHHLHRVPSLEHQLSAEQPIADTPQRVQVDSMIGVGGPEHHLGSHECWSAAGASLGAEFDIPEFDVGGLRPLCRVELDQTEVEHLGEIKGDSPATHYHVGRLDIAMHQAVLMCILKRG